jgi:aminoglycoside 2'-N-acetyltransferase I
MWPSDPKAARSAVRRLGEAIREATAEIGGDSPGLHLGDPMEIQRIATSNLSSTVDREVHALCAEAYEEDLAWYFTSIGPGVHLLGWVDGRLVSHLMWVTRTLYLDHRVPLRTAYIELVATGGADRGRGYASALMRRAADEIREFELGALSPTVPDFYARLGWESWRGPLAVRTDSGLEPSPEEHLMVLLLPGTPAALDLGAPLSVDWRPGEVW